MLNIVAMGIFGATLLYGVCLMCMEELASSGLLIALTSIAGVLLILLGKIARSFWRINTPFSALMLIYVFVFLAVVPGELFGFYYIIWWWDVFLHVFSGFGLTYIAYLIINYALEKAKIKYAQGVVVIFAVLSSLGCAAIWEVIEFSIDSIFETNMQKVVPAEFLVDNTGSVGALEASDQELADYYRQPSGYRYAVMDTMEDHISYMSGAMLWVLIYTVGKNRRVA